MTVFRMIPPGNGKNGTVIVNGRSVTCALGSSIDVQLPFDAHVLEANGWMRAAIAGVGTTALRPTPNSNAIGQEYLDTTVGFIIKWDGVAWRNPLTGASV